MITLEVSGIRYTDFEGASVSFSMDTFSREFSFSATAAEGNPLPFKGGEACKVFVDGDQVLSGYIDIVSGGYDSRSHSIDILGRGKTSDLFDSTLDSLELSSEISMEDAIKAAINQLGVDISVANNAGNIAIFNKAEDEIGASVGDGAFDFIETLARKRQVILNEDEFGDISINRAKKDRYSEKLQNIISSDENNIKSASFNYDLTGIYREYIVKSQQNTAALNFSGVSDLASVTSQSGRSSSSQTRAGRQLAFVAEKASGNEQLTSRAVWESNIRRARSREYIAIVVGQKASTGEKWETNKIISVNDQFAGIKEDMLINRVTFITSKDDGNITELVLIDKDAYTPNPADSLSDSVGGEFLF